MKRRTLASRWMSCSWKRTWSSSHPPNTQTKEKMRKYRLQKAGRRISLDVMFLEKDMELLPPPNTQTKEKMRKYRLQKAGRRISLFRTAGNFRNSLWSPRPESRCQNIFHKHHHHKRTPYPTKSAVRKHSPSPSAQLQWIKKTESENWSELH